MRRLGLPLFRPPDGLVTENLRQLGRRVLAFYGPEALAEQSREQFRSKSGKSGIPPLKASLTGLRLRVLLLILKSYSKMAKLIMHKELT